MEKCIAINCKILHWQENIEITRKPNNDNFKVRSIPMLDDDEGLSDHCVIYAFIETNLGKQEPEK